MAGVSTRVAYDWIQGNREFDAQYQAALKDSTEALEREAWRRGVEGVQKPVYHLGKRIDTIREYSDQLLVTLLKGRKPSVYRERVEHSGPGGGPISVAAAVPIERLTDAELELLERIYAKASPPKVLGPGT